MWAMIYPHALWLLNVANIIVNVLLLCLNILGGGKARACSLDTVGNV